MGNLLKTIGRHVVGVGAGAAATGVATVAAPNLTAGDPEEAFATLLTAVFVAVYAITEKSLKPLWLKLFNEE